MENTENKDLEQENAEQNIANEDEKTEETNTENTQDAEDTIEDTNTIEKQLDEEKAKSKGYLDKLQRSIAEFDNFRKRTMQEKTLMYENGAKDCIEKLLPILDNFERAISSTKEEDRENSIYKGVEMIHNQMLDAFSGMGLEEIDGVGEVFDPNMHNAVMHIEDENLGENTVAEVLQKGYTYKNKVVRPSMVKVAN